MTPAELDALIARADLGWFGYEPAKLIKLLALYGDERARAERERAVQAARECRLVGPTARLLVAERIRALD